jgi:hypothetical protein
MAAVSDTAASGTATSAGKGVEISKAIFNAIAISQVQLQFTLVI